MSVREYIEYIYKDELKDILYYVVYKESDEFIENWKIKIVKKDFINKEINVDKKITDFYYENKYAIIRDKKLRELGI